MAIPLESARDEIAARLAAAEAVWIGTDFDGTLTEHCDDPFAVALPGPVRDTIRRLTEFPRLAVAIVSGRSLADLVPRVAMPELAYAGNHGLEIEAPGLTYADPEALAAAGELNRFIARIAPVAAAIPGAFVENKRLTVEVHTRKSAPGDRPALQREIDAALADSNDLIARHVELGSEIRPARAGHKGTAVLQLWEHQTGRRALPFFFGDAGTDEDAFAALADGITVKVGDGPTQARYRVDHPTDIHRFLVWLSRQSGGIS